MHRLPKKLCQLMAIAGLVSFSLLSSRVALYQLLYVLNQRGLTATVCVKRTPNCHARCFLQKQIASAGSQDEHSASGDAAPLRFQEMPRYDPFLAPPADVACYSPIHWLLRPSDFFLDTDDFHPAVFRPPEILA